jgi:hypothetical protein
MFVLLAAALLQGTAPAAPARDTVPATQPARDSAAADSTRRPARSVSVGPSRWRRVAVTDEHRRTAFDDAAARDLLLHARAARLRQDTSLLAYDATTFQRVSAGLGIRRFGRERLIYRGETATRVRWRRGEGAVVDVVGSREATLGEGKGGIDISMGSEMGPIPYFPGQETLWIGSEQVQTGDDDDDDDMPIIHPLTEGAEAYYRYRTGDSVAVRLADGRSIRLRELRVRPRSPQWNLAVGSLWFDVDNAHLVRAVYRLATPIEVWEVVTVADSADAKDIPWWVKTMVNPLRASLKAVTVEYGLEAGRFWLPRLQAMEGEAEAGPMRVPFHFEQSYKYASVNAALDSMPAVPPEAERRARVLADSLWRDSLARAPEEQRDSLRAARRRLRRAACDTAATRQSVSSQFGDRLTVLVRTPCDSTALIASPALPPSIFAEGDELFDAKMQEALVEAALSLGAQADWAPTRPTIKYGLGDGLLRYNRVEGLSPAVRADAQLGRGYSASALARLGTADWQPNGELSLARSDGRRTLRLGAYRRLTASNDWGDPLGLSSSLSALLFGRDEGFYYRTWGAELAGEGRPTGGGGVFSWRLFSERHDRADVETQFALWNKIRDTTFLPNIAAEEGSVTGLGARWVRTFGLDPRRARLLTDVRGEGGVGSFGYGRLLADLTLSRPLIASLDGALTVSGGSSVGEVPVQRRFHLGGPFSVRGLSAGVASGDAYWMARAEVGASAVTFRPVVFYDMGWAGDRADWRHPGRPLSGAGVGASVLDGLFRFDVSRGLHPTRQWRVDAYLEARF